MLFDTRRFAGTSAWAVAFDPERITVAVQAFLDAVGDDSARAALRAQIRNLTKSKPAETRLQTVTEICQAFAAAGDPPSLLRGLDAAVEETKNLFSYFDSKLPPGPYTGGAAR